MSETDGDLEAQRARIDEIDRQLVALLNERAALSLEIGRLKAADKSARVYVPAREVIVYSNIFSSNRGPLTDSALKRIYDQILEESRRLQGDSPLT